MIYVFDTSSFQQLFHCYHADRFPSLWRKFDELVERRAITSVENVMREISNRDKKHGELEWAQKHPDLFPRATADESQFFHQIYQIPQFRHVVPADIRDIDTPADPYLIARAKTIEGMIITQERQRGNRVGIPSICRHFGVNCGTLDDLMDAEGWSF